VVPLAALAEVEPGLVVCRRDVAGVGDFGAAELRPGRGEAVAGEDDEDGGEPAGAGPNRPTPAGVESAAVRRCSPSEEVGTRNAAPTSAQSNKPTTVSNTIG
jgi:hypothetical protein